MTAQGDQGTHLLKANFRVGETVSKPILSLMEVIDNGAEVWLSKGLMKMYINHDYENGSDLARRHNTLGIEVMKFKPPGRPLSTRRAAQRSATTARPQAWTWATSRSTAPGLRRAGSRPRSVGLEQRLPRV
jgi:hypothetical protein